MDKSDKEKMVAENYYKQFRRGGSIVVVISLLGFPVLFGAEAYEKAKLPEPTPIVRRYESVNNSLSTLRNKLNEFKTFELPYANEQMRQELQSIEEEGINEITKSLENALEYAKKDSIEIANSPEFTDYLNKKSRANKFGNLRYAALFFPLLGLFLNGFFKRKAERKRDKSL